MTASHAAVTRSHNHRVTEKDVLIEKEADLLARIAKLKEDDLRSEPLRVEMTRRECEMLKKVEQASSERAQ